MSVGQTSLLERVDRSGMAIELDDRFGHACERQAGELEPRLGRGDRVLVSWIGDHEDEEAVETQLRNGRATQREMTVVRWVEHAAEDRYCHSSSSSPTSTWVPRLIPRPRRAASSSSAGGGVPTTR